jgi:pyruvate formate lyase activating enzyme
MPERPDPTTAGPRRAPLGASPVGALDAAPAGVSRRDVLAAGLAGACALCLGSLPHVTQVARAQAARAGLVGRAPSPWFEALDDGALRCTLCPLRCRLADGERGRCRVRENRGGTGYTLAYGNPCLVQLDPVERKPFFHVLPGTRALSVSTAGCPLACRFCEVWDMALVAPEEVVAYDLPPETLVRHALAVGATSVSFAFGEPVAFFEYALDTAALARSAGLRVLVHTSGYLEEGPLAALAPLVDAVNVDLKAFDDGFYRELCGAELAPVLRSLRFLHGAGVHVELTNLVIPTLNDDADQVRSMSRWIADELGPDVPLHFSRFYPLYQLANLPPTPVSSLDRARAIAREEGLRYVYVSRVTGHEGEDTFCPHCGATVIARLGFMVEDVALDGGCCRACGGPIAGRWS